MYSTNFNSINRICVELNSTCMSIHYYSPLLIIIIIIIIIMHTHKEHRTKPSCVCVCVCVCILIKEIHVSIHEFIYKKESYLFQDLIIGNENKKTSYNINIKFNSNV